MDRFHDLCVRRSLDLWREMKTFVPKNPGEIRDWLLVDVADKPLGRIAVEISNSLRGKGKPTFTPHVDTGDFVVVINAEKVKLTGKKEELKLYQSYSGYRGGLKKVPASFVRERHPERMIMKAVKGMLPKNNLSRTILKRLKVYSGSEHPHAAQDPKIVELV